jgi:hypothetical protein
VTDARLHSDKPIDDEIPFEDARTIRRNEAPDDRDALVTPVAAERENTLIDPTVEPSTRLEDQTDLEGE